MLYRWRIDGLSLLILSVVVVPPVDLLAQWLLWLLRGCASFLLLRKCKRISRNRCSSLRSLLVRILAFLA